MARLPMDIENRGRIGRLVARYSRRRYGAVLDPAARYSNDHMSGANLYHVAVPRKVLLRKGQRKSL